MARGGDGINRGARREGVAYRERKRERERETEPQRKSALLWSHIEIQIYSYISSRALLGQSKEGSTHTYERERKYTTSSLSVNREIEREENSR